MNFIVIYFIPYFKNEKKKTNLEPSQGSENDHGVYGNLREQT